MAENGAKRAFNIEEIRNDFPILSETINGKRLAFLDSAASAQKPKVVLDRLLEAYSKQYANVHRGIYSLSEMSTTAFEQARENVAKFINASSEKEIVFTRGATESINLIAHSYAITHLQKDDEILISELEHHANIVPWQLVAKKTGAKLKVVPVSDDGEFDFDQFKNRLNSKTKIVSMLQISNALGTILPTKEIIELSHQNGAVVVVDACQSAVHTEIDVQELGADFLVFSGHKIYGPNGVGVLYGRYELLEKMEPYQSGGEMIDVVDFEESTFQKPPLRFEAGTPIIAEVIAFSSALEYLQSFDRNQIHEHEMKLENAAREEIEKLSGYKVIGPKQNKAAIISIIHEEAHPNDIGSILDQTGVAVRTGHHCAMPLMKKLGLSATARISFAMYNNQQDVDDLVAGLKKVNKLFGIR